MRPAAPEPACPSVRRHVTQHGSHDSFVPGKSADHCCTYAGARDTEVPAVMKRTWLSVLFRAPVFREGARHSSLPRYAAAVGAAVALSWVST